MSDIKAGFVGLGAMGEPMAGHLHRAGLLAAAELPDKHRGTYRGIATSVAFRELQRYENALVQREVGDRLAVAYGRWQPVYESVDKQLREFETELKDEVSQRVASQTNGLLVRLAVIGFTGLAAVIVTIALTFVWGRAVIRQLVALRKAAQELSRKLPEVVARLRRGESADDVVEPSALVRRGDEIGDVARALADSQQAVVAAASGEARLRQGFHEVFLNIARRNQALLHRQFTVLDEMERRTVDVQDLEDLFRIDHLATRMRRNAENLVILAGAHPGRGWRDPIPMIDVIRGAISEIEDYARVKVTRVPDAALAGHAVADVIHLLAELLENATSFSPPHARVTISGELAATGYVVEIEDRGLGMDAETIAELNRKLAEPPDFDPATSERLGIFVVSLLAARHRIKVSLRPSPYGGTTAITFVPRDLLADPHARALPAARARADATTPSAAETAEVPALTGTGGPTAGDGAQPAKVRAALPRRHVAKQDDEKQDDAMQDHVSEPAPDPVEERSRPPRPRPSSDTTRANLPRRRRQTHLAPQLATAPPETTPDSGDADTAERSPEEIRRLMSSFQAGMTRGRAEAGTSDDDLSFPEDDTDEAGNHSPWRTEGDR